MYVIIHPIEPFDASIGTEIKFTWKGNQIFKALELYFTVFQTKLGGVT